MEPAAASDSWLQRFRLDCKTFIFRAILDSEFYYQIIHFCLAIDNRYFNILRRKSEIRYGQVRKYS